MPRSGLIGWLGGGGGVVMVAAVAVAAVVVVVIGIIINITIIIVVGDAVINCNKIGVTTVETLKGLNKNEASSTSALQIMSITIQYFNVT